jgi:hypothetical protein
MEISKLLNPISPSPQAEPKHAEPSNLSPSSHIIPEPTNAEAQTTAPLDADLPPTVLEIFRSFQKGVRNNEAHGQRFHMHATVLKTFNHAAGPHIIKGLKVDKKKVWSYLVEDDSGERRWVVERDLEAA